MMSWFGLGGPKVTAKDRAILDLKRQRDKIKQYQKRLSTVLARERELAKECLAKGDRRRALIFLRKEKMQKQMLAKTDQQLESLEELVDSIEFAQVQKDVVFGLEQGAAVLKQINAEMSIERVERIMDDTAEAKAYQEEVSMLLREQVTNSDELEIERELEEMEAAMKPKEATKDAAAIPAVPSRVKDAPKAPTGVERNETEERAEGEEPMAA